MVSFKNALHIFFSQNKLKSKMYHDFVQKTHHTTEEHHFHFIYFIVTVITTIVREGMSLRFREACSTRKDASHK